ncbi:MAG: YhcH/YjgK/YiaL family protein [Clostridia bacterium]|nr:YhcH/YjgK/YiaL family protein [Clostridia bacterium]
MIFDTIENAKCYAGLNARVDAALAYAKDITPENFPTSQVILDGDNLFVNAANYATHDETDAMFEAHRKYIDVMVMIEGEELIYVKPTARLTEITSPYTEENEAVLAKLDDDATPVHMTPGCVCVLMPQDAHAPGCAVTESMKIKKLICKVKI